MTMYVVKNAGKQIHEQNHYISFVFLFPIFFSYKNNGTKGNYFQKKFIKFNIQLDIYYSYKSTDSIYPFLSSGNHFQYFTNNNFLKSVELKYQFF